MENIMSTMFLKLKQSIDVLESDHSESMQLKIFGCGLGIEPNKHRANAACLSIMLPPPIVDCANKQM